MNLNIVSLFMSKFEREDRYLVIKRSDINEYFKSDPFHSKSPLKSALRLASNAISEHRCGSGKEPLECIVVESDWPIYNDVWKMVEAIAKGESTELEQLRKELETLNDAIDNILNSPSFDGELMKRIAEEAKSDLVKLNQQAGE